MYHRFKIAHTPNQKMKPFIYFLALVSVFGSAVLQFASVFQGDSVVLQSDRDGARMWGTAASNARVTVSVDAEPAGVAVADRNGRWEILLPPHHSSWLSTVSATDGISRVETLVKFGVVLFCSGQRYVFYFASHYYHPPPLIL